MPVTDKARERSRNHEKASGLNGPSRVRMQSMNTA